MDSVWVITEERGVETEILEITATEELAKEYVENNSPLYNHDKMVLVTDQSDLKVWAIVDENVWSKYEDPDEYFDDHLNCVSFTIRRWSVLTDLSRNIKPAKQN